MVGAAAGKVVPADNFAFDTPFAHPNGTLYVVTVRRVHVPANLLIIIFKIFLAGSCQLEDAVAVVMHAVPVMSLLLMMRLS